MTTTERGTRPAPRRAVSVWRGLWASIITMRPYASVWFVGVPVTTFALIQGEGSFGTKRWLLFLIAGVCADAAMTTINDLGDQVTDRSSVERSRSARPLARGDITERHGRIQAIVLVSVAAVFSLLLSPWVFAALIGVLGYCLSYNAKSVYASGRPIVSQVFWVVLWIAMYLVVALVLGGDLSLGWLYLIGVAVFMGVGESLAKDIRDVDNDRIAGKRTTPVVYGVAGTSVVSVAGFLAGAVCIVAFGYGRDRLLGAVIGTWLLVWVVQAIAIAVRLRRDYDKADGAALHDGSITVLLGTNLIMCAWMLA